MTPRLDVRLGSVLGLTGRYRDKRAFEIVNDTHDWLGTLTPRLITFKYSGPERFSESSSLCEKANRQRLQYSGRLNLLSGNAIDAARLAEEIDDFVKTVIDPWLTKFERAGGREA
ncbi:hypothetical protein [Mesorhizobium sp. M1409]|uniref:hypothetical protein n=1 Tax=unclassified Mesorhizobium TaxID=325217 RepID=UPI003335C191